MSSPESFCAIVLANDAQEIGKIFGCSTCAVRARKDADGIVEVITRNVCLDLVVDAAASTEESSRALQAAYRPEYSI